MSQQISLDLQPKATPSLKQTQRLIMSPQMQQAIHLLQMPVLELTATLEQELQQNPVVDFIEEHEEDYSTQASLEHEHAEEPIEKEQPPEKELVFNEHDFEILKRLDEDFRDHFAQTNSYRSPHTSDDDKLKTYQESLIRSDLSLFEHLMSQAKETFSEPEEIKVAEVLIGNFDENGFLKTSLEEIACLNNFDQVLLKKLLTQIQTFEPYGIGASSLQESLLIQLACHNKQNTLAYQIIEQHYDDLIHNRIPQISKGLDCTPEQIRNSLNKDISRLDLHPGQGHFKHLVQYIVPDVTVEEEDQKLIIRANNDSLPPIRINRRYLKMLDNEELPNETKDFIRSKLASVKWLFHNVHQRNQTLVRIVEYLVDIQKSFFTDLEGKLIPLTMKSVSEHLELHESTIARAVANKYVSCLRGTLPLRSFFTSAILTQAGQDISSNTAKKVLQELINEEDKKHPLSDAALSKALELKGIICARRTIAKYRGELNLGNAQQRRKY